MGQFKEPIESVVSLNFGGLHSLITGHCPDAVIAGGYKDLKFREGDNTGIGSFGLFSSSTNRFYPGLTSEDWEPSSEDYIKPVFRMLSEVIVNKSSWPTDFSQNGVLKASYKKIIGQTINTNHNTDVEDGIGVVVDAYWEDAYKDQGVIVPAGFNGILKIDAKANPRIARGVLSEPPIIHSNSVNVRFLWDKSHPELEGYDFWNKLGTYDKNGNLVRQVVTEIKAYGETSLVSHGADPFAQRINEKGKIENPKYAGAINNAEMVKAREVKYYVIDYSDQANLSAIGDTIAYNIKDTDITNNSNSESNMNEEMKKFIESLLAAGINLGEGVEATDAAVLEAVKALITSSSTLSETITSLEADKATLTTEVEDLKAKVSANEANAILGESYIKDLRESTVTLYSKLNTEPDENIIQLINSSGIESVKALQKNYQAALEKEFPMSCKDCGSTHVERSTSQATTEEETNNSGGESGSNLSVSEMTRKMAKDKLNKK